MRDRSLLQTHRDGAHLPVAASTIPTKGADWIVTIYEGYMFDEPVVEAPCSVRMKGVAEQEYGQRAYSE